MLEFGTVMAVFDTSRLFRVGEADDYSTRFWNWYLALNAEKLYL